MPPAARRTWADRLRRLRPLAAAFEGWQIRRFGRSLLGLVARTEVLLLETTGRRTGRPRATPLACVEHDGGWLIAGGAGGQTRVDWVANLRANPRATAVVARRRVPVLAVEPTGAEALALHARARERWPQIEGYERRSGRATPVFVLRPTEAQPG